MPQHPVKKILITQLQHKTDSGRRANFIPTDDPDLYYVLTVTSGQDKKPQVAVRHKTDIQKVYGIELSNPTLTYFQSGPKPHQ